MPNRMTEPRIEKVTINFAAGEGGERLDKAITIIREITGRTPVKTMTFKRIPDFGIRPKTVVGCKLTLRGKEAEEFLSKAFTAVEKKLKETVFDTTGNFSFGIKEHIDLPGADYNPALGIIGMDICVTLERPGYRVKRRSLKKKPVGSRHKLTRKEAMEFVKNKFGVSIVKEGE